MSKILIALLLFFFLLLGGLGYIAITLKENAAFKIPFQSNPSPTITTIHSLTLSPENSDVIQGQTNTIDIIFETQNSNYSKPQVIQMEISYDPTALLDVDIVPGDFFTNPTEALKTINTHTGRISYALESDPSSPTSTYMLKNRVATISFTPNPTFTKNETALSFLGKTKIRDKAQDNIIMATYGTLLFFATGSAAPGL